MYHNRNYRLYVSAVNLEHLHGTVMAFCDPDLASMTQEQSPMRKRSIEEATKDGSLTTQVAIEHMITKMEQKYADLQNAVNAHLSAQDVIDVYLILYVHIKGILDEAYAKMENTLD